MQEILAQLLKVVLALLTLITTYLVGHGALSQSATTTAQTQNNAQVQTQAQTQTAAAVPIVPAAPASTTATQGATAAATATTGTTTAASNTTGTAGTSVAIGGVSNVNVQSATTNAATTATTTQTTTTTAAADSVTPILDDSVYGADSYVPQPEVAGAFYVAPNGSDSNPGTKEQPWATIQHAADTLTAGQTVYIRGGTYPISTRIVTKNSGTADKWITFAAYPGEQPVIEAKDMELGNEQYPHDLGAFWISNNVQYVRVEGLTVQNSPASGFSVCRGKHIVLVGNRVNGSYTPGISANSTYNHDCESADIKILRNTLVNTNNIVFSRGMQTDGEAPHESISIMGTDGFEIAFNHIHDTAKEGIDVKERSKNGVVHNNLVENIARQCFYVDAWYGTLENIEWYGNIGRRCGFMGFAVSVENGSGEPAVVNNVSFHHNLIDSAQGTGVYFSRFNADGLRKNVKIYNNTVYNSGHNVGWIVGGLALLSDNVHDTQIYDNIFAENSPFQMGASVEYGGMAGLAQRNITLENNLINGPQNGADMYDGSMQPIEGTDTRTGDPQFVNPAAGDFRLKDGSPAKGTGKGGGNIGAF